MANIRGEGGTKNKEMLVSIRLPKDSNIKDGVHKTNAKACKEQILGNDKATLVNVQMNNIGVAPEAADTNPYLFTEQVTRKDGTVGYNHGVWYDNKEKPDGQLSQVQEMLSQCDKYSVANGYATFAIKGDVGVRKEGGLYVKTETVQKSDQPITATLAADQFKATRDAQKYAKEHQAETPQSDAVAQATATAEKAETQAENAGASMDEPQA